MNTKFQEFRKFGFTNFSEKINGRVAMLGLILIIITEILSKKGVLEIVSKFIK